MAELHSMTGFASETGQGAGHSWTWDLRSVNGRGLDIRVRLPEGLAGVDRAVRRALTDALNRGNVTASLKLTRDDSGAVSGQVDRAALTALLEAAKTVEAAAEDHGLTLRESSALEILTWRGVMLDTSGDADAEALDAALVASFASVLEAFITARAEEGRALSAILNGQLSRIAELTEAAAAAAEARQPKVAERLREALAQIRAESKLVRGADWRSTAPSCGTSKVEPPPIRSIRSIPRKLTPSLDFPACWWPDPTAMPMMPRTRGWRPTGAT